MLLSLTACILLLVLGTAIWGLGPALLGTPATAEARATRFGRVLCLATFECSITPTVLEQQEYRGRTFALIRSDEPAPRYWLFDCTPSLRRCSIVDAAQGAFTGTSIDLSARPRIATTPPR